MANPTRRTTTLDCRARPPPQLAVEGTHRYPPNPSPSPSATVVSSDSHPPDSIVVGLRSDSNVEDKGIIAPVDRWLTCTPDPTPSEEFLLTHKARQCNWARILDWRRYKNPRVFWPLAVTVTLVLILILFIAFKDQLVDKMRPFANWMYDTPGGWVIPIGLLILFGHEIVAILCGIVWGIWLGFAIVAAGTALGELANFYVYKWWCGARGRKLEESNLNWAILAEVIRTGGLKMPLLMRLTYIPSHFLTAVFSTCGMNFWIFTASAVLSLPKQLAVVFVGVSGANGEELPTTTRAIKYTVIGVSVLPTLVAMWYVCNRMDEVKGVVIYARRKRRQAKLLAAAGYQAPDLAYDSEERAGEERLGGAMTETQAQVDELEFSREPGSPSPQAPASLLPPPPHSSSRPNSSVDPVVTRSDSPGAVWHYPKASVDEGPRSPHLSHLTSVEFAHEQSGGAAQKRRSTSVARSATPKSGFALVEASAVAAANRSVLAHGRDQGHDQGLDAKRG
ncbi:hypothetical protein LXA43DRAFT_1085375 [Ganoderma leucocontextum]|nr:hypothetical protein LXA43DRAFT_1085375 [Ganoderma leucocontextum]